MSVASTIRLIFSWHREITTWSEHPDFSFGNHSSLKCVILRVSQPLASGQGCLELKHSCWPLLPGSESGAEWLKTGTGCSSMKQTVALWSACLLCRCSSPLIQLYLRFLELLAIPCSKKVWTKLVSVACNQRIPRDEFTPCNIINILSGAWDVSASVCPRAHLPRRPPEGIRALPWTRILKSGMCNTRGLKQLVGYSMT